MSDRTAATTEGEVLLDLDVDDGTGFDDIKISLDDKEGNESANMLSDEQYVELVQGAEGKSGILGYYLLSDELLKGHLQEYGISEVFLKNFVDRLKEDKVISDGTVAGRYKISQRGLQKKIEDVVGKYGDVDGGDENINPDVTIDLSSVGGELDDVVLYFDDEEPKKPRVANTENFDGAGTSIDLGALEGPKHDLDDVTLDLDLEGDPVEPTPPKPKSGKLPALDLIGEELGERTIEEKRDDFLSELGEVSLETLSAKNFENETKNVLTFDDLKSYFLEKRNEPFVDYRGIDKIIDYLGQLELSLAKLDNDPLSNETIGILNNIPKDSGIRQKVFELYRVAYRELGINTKDLDSTLQNVIRDKHFHGQTLPEVLNRNQIKQIVEGGLLDDQHKLKELIVKYKEKVVIKGFNQALERLLKYAELSGHQLPEDTSLNEIRNLMSLYKVPEGEQDMIYNAFSQEANRIFREQTR